MDEQPTAELARELVHLVRRLRDLSTALHAAGGQRVEAALVPLLGRVADEGPLRLSDLAARVGLDLSTVSRQVAQLERRGWLERTADPEDRRASLLRLTAEGRRVHAELLRSRADLLARLLPDWSDADLRAFSAYAARATADITAHREAVVGAARDPRPDHVHPGLEAS